jgi:tetratricopeptide (TPR) repeat protein
MYCTLLIAQNNRSKNMKSTKHSYLLITLLSALVLSPAAKCAQESAWQNSYKLEASGKYSEAITAIDSVAANGADAELKSLRRGWLYYLQGNYSEAIREYRYSVERNKQSVDARLGITLPMLAQKRWREAEQNARESLELAPNNYTGLLRLTLALEGQRDWGNMAKTATTLVNSYPTDATAYTYLARAYAWQGRRNEAVAAYSAVLSRYPGHLEAKAFVEQK